MDEILVCKQNKFIWNKYLDYKEWRNIYLRDYEISNR